MSAIFGIFYRDGRPVDPADVERMQAILTHRGPDGTDTWVRGPVGLGHRMLHTTPESLYEHQPIVSRDGALVLTADARIDNRDELISMLDVRDRPSGLVTDADLILAAYERWGERCPEHLLGDFAFAVWDARKQQLFCARDHFGIKSLYYHAQEQYVVFATEIKAILTITSVSRAIDELRIAEELTRPFQDNSRTIYQSIKRLPAASFLVANKSNTKQEIYWRLDPTREITLSSSEEYAQLVRHTFLDAVRMRSRSVGSIGTMLSGGLDSSAITCVLRDYLAQDIHKSLYTFSAVFDSIPKSNDREYVEEILKQGGVTPFVFNADQYSPLFHLSEMTKQNDEPITAGNAYILWLSYKEAHIRGVRTIFDGFDGDTTISHGKGRFIELAIHNQWIRLAIELKWFLDRTGQSGLRKVWWRWFEEYQIKPYKSRISNILLSISSFKGNDPKLPKKPASWSKFINPEFSNKIDLYARFTDSARFPKSDREAQYMTLTDVSEVQGIELLDHLAGAFNLEPRLPFWDKRLIELCLAIPSEQKLYQGWARMVFRRAMRGIVPEKILWRGRKSDMSPAFYQGFFNSHQNLLEELLFGLDCGIEQYVNLPYLQSIYKERAERPLTSSEKYALWTTVSLAIWLHQNTARQ